MFRILNGSTPKTDEPAYWDGEIPWATPDDLGGLDSAYLAVTARRITKDGYEHTGTALAPPGSLILSTRAPIGHLAITTEATCTNQGCRSLVLRQEADERFFYYVMLAAREVLQSLGQGSTFRELSGRDLGGFPLPVPPTPEQATIADFLARETRNIDALIAKKQRLLELLDERHRVLIERVVTNGLDSTVVMKDSEVDWLGRIPMHWEVVRLKRVAVLQRGFDLPEVERREGDFPIVSSAGIVASHDIGPVGAPGVVIGRYGSVGSAFYLDDAFWPLNTTLYVKNFLGNDASFVYWLLRAMSEMATDAEGQKTAVPGVNRNHLHVLHVARPPNNEQRDIARWLWAASQTLSAGKDQIRRGIAALLRMRSALISAAVTGKIDVREDVA